jgi:hypothetical protein
VAEKGKDIEMTPFEKVIYNIWSEALKTSDIKPTDNFFEVGGNSLMAISVFSKMNTTFNLDLNLRVFFDSPRIKDMAEMIDFELHKSVLINKSEENKKNDDKQIVSGEL